MNQGIPNKQRALGYSLVRDDSGGFHLFKFLGSVPFLMKPYSRKSSSVSAGSSEKQKEADEKHRALSNSMNDFATLLSVFQSCKSR